MPTKAKPKTTRKAPAKRAKPAASPASRKAPTKRAAARQAPSKGGMPKGSLDHLPRTKDGVILLSGGNPRIAKADGDAPVQAYIDAVQGWKHDVARRIDALVTKSVPGAVKAVKWNSPFYGMPGQGWFMSFHVFAKAVKVTFFRGTSLRPPVTGGTGKEARWIDVHEDDLDEAQMAAWLKQAAALPGWGSS